MPNIVQTDRINSLAQRRKEKWLRRYGGTVGLEWMFPKILETLEKAPSIYRAADVWVEAGDWFVWQLVGCDVADLPRSTCQAGYKALWSGSGGYPSKAFFKAGSISISNDFLGTFLDFLDFTKVIMNQRMINAGKPTMMKPMTNMMVEMVIAVESRSPSSIKLR